MNEVNLPFQKDFNNSLSVNGFKWVFSKSYPAYGNSVVCVGATFLLDRVGNNIVTFGDMWMVCVDVALVISDSGNNTVQIGIDGPDTPIFEVTVAEGNRQHQELRKKLIEFFTSSKQRVSVIIRNPVFHGSLKDFDTRLSVDSTNIVFHNQKLNALFHCFIAEGEFSLSDYNVTMQTQRRILKE